LSRLQPALLRLASSAAERVATAFRAPGAGAGGAGGGGGGAASGAAAAAAAAARWSEEECRFACRVARKLVDAIHDLDAATTSAANKFPGLRPECERGHRELQAAATRVFLGACDGAAALHRGLLVPAALSADPDVPYHSIQASSRAAVLMWRSCSEARRGGAAWAHLDAWAARRVARG
jgi:hypothetical protein